MTMSSSPRHAYPERVNALGLSTAYSITRPQIATNSSGRKSGCCAAERKQSDRKYLSRY